MNQRVLFVDDDPLVLNALRRSLRGKLDIETAEGPSQALPLLTAQNAFAVIVADMQMPGMDGVQFLAHVRERCPDTVRIMLTGAHDQQTAIAAINDGQIFRFITKPCAAETMLGVIADALRQYRLVTAERELLEQTLNGSVRLLTDVLALIDAEGFGRLEHLRQDIRALGSAVNLSKTWEVEIAAMLSPIGRLTVPAEVLRRAAQGERLNAVEADLFARIPETGSMLLANIPRLDEVARIVLYQRKRYDGGGFPPDSLRGNDIPMGARVLALLLDLDALESGGMARVQALRQLGEDQGKHDPALITAALSALPVRRGAQIARAVISVGITGLRPGHVLRAPVRSGDGVVLVGIGQVVTPALIERLTNFHRTAPLHEPVSVEDIPVSPGR